MGRYKKRIDFQKKLQIFLVVILVLFSFLYIYFMSRPEVKVYNLEDSCGVIGGEVSHQIGDADECENACRANCLSFELSIENSEFFPSFGEGCHNCTCYCK